MRGMTVLVVAAVVVTAACTGQPESPSASLSVSSAKGNYALTAVGGHPLPANAYFGVDVSIAAEAGTLTLVSDGTFALSISLHQHFASGNRDVRYGQGEHGTWSVTAGELTLTPDGHPPRKATVSGNDISFELDVTDLPPPPGQAGKTYTFTRTQ